jgi:hypothetical protein
MLTVLKKGSIEALSMSGQRILRPDQRIPLPPTTMSMLDAGREAVPPDHQPLIG